MSPRHAYDPDRVATLHRHTLDAVAHLSAMRSSDPDAAAAMRAVRLVRHELERVWLPAITALMTCTALTVGWAGAGPAIAADAPRPPAVDVIDRSSFELHDAIRFLRPSAPDAWDAHVALLERIAALPMTSLITLWDDMGPEVRARLLFLHGAALRAVDEGRLDGRHRALANEAIGRLLGAEAHVRPAEVHALLSTPTTTNPALIEAVAAAVRHVPGPTITRLAGALVRAVAADRHADATSANTVLAALGRRAPATSLDLLDDAEVRHALLTDDRFDTEVVARLVSDALGRAPVDPATKESAAIALADVVALASDLTAGARLGVSSSMSTWWPIIDVLLVFRADDGGRSHLSAVIFEDSTDTALGAQTANVRLGTFAEFDRLLAELLRDDASQAALGASVGAYTATELRAAADRLLPGDDLATVEANRESLTTALTYPRHVMETIHDAGDAAEDLAALEQAHAISAISETVGWASAVAGFVPGGLAVSRVATIGLRVLREGTDILRDVAPPVTGHETGMSGMLPVAMVLLPLRHRRARRRLGLGEVPDDVWDELQQRTDAVAAFDPLSTAHADARNELVTSAHRVPALADHLRRVAE
jgi:hypothetical protein